MGGGLDFDGGFFEKNCWMGGHNHPPSPLPTMGNPVEGV